MTTEDDFQAALDANPGDWQTRLVFADWLQERDDPRAEGYRALGQLKKAPAPSTAADENSSVIKYDWTWYNSGAGAYGEPDHENHLPDLWLTACQGGRNARQVNGLSFGPNDWKDWPTRREADDAAAFAFASLPNELFSLT